MQKPYVHERSQKPYGRRLAPRVVQSVKVKDRVFSEYLRGDPWEGAEDLVAQGLVDWYEDFFVLQQARLAKQQQFVPLSGPNANEHHKLQKIHDERSSFDGTESTVSGIAGSPGFSAAACSLESCSSSSSLSESGDSFATSDKEQHTTTAQRSPVVPAARGLLHKTSSLTQLLHSPSQLRTSLSATFLDRTLTQSQQGSELEKPMDGCGLQAQPEAWLPSSCLTQAKSKLGSLHQKS